jgi:glycosyltransferase involved in cell wall biosynthesis
MRIAYLPDSFHEVNGVAHTSRNFAAYAQRHSIEMLCIRAAPPQPTTPPGGPSFRNAKGWVASRSKKDGPSVTYTYHGTLRTLDLRRSRASLGLEKDLSFDPLFFRHAAEIESALRSFRPDVIHITGPSELGLFGAWFAHKLGVPLVASWHTNLHEYAARRLTFFDHIVPRNPAQRIHRAVERGSLAALARFYSFARVLYAPNNELCDLLTLRTGKPCQLMQRGVDTTLFTPARRTRPRDSETLVLGYVGRLSVEKNVALLVRAARELEAIGVNNVRFRIIGHGSEEAMLRRELPNADFPGVLRGEALAAAYADMDLFLFPSHTDTFGNVVLEALASGVPAIVVPSGGPRFIVSHGENGLIAHDSGFANAVASLARDRALLARMSRAARAHALTCSWDAVFDSVLTAYPVPQAAKEPPAALATAV